MIEQVIIIALTVFAIWQVFQQGHILENVGLFLEKHLPEAIHKPVFSCPICMTIWYGLVLSLLLGYQLWLPVPAMGLVALLIKYMPDEE